MNIISQLLFLTVSLWTVIAYNKEDTANTIYNLKHIPITDILFEGGYVLPVFVLLIPFIRVLLEIPTLEDTTFINLGGIVFEDGSVAIWDIEDKDAFNLYKLYEDTRDVFWDPTVLEVREGQLWNAMFFDITNPLIAHLRVINPGLFTPVLITPASVYSVDGYNIEEIYFHIPIIAPNHSTWEHMINTYNLYLTTFGYHIPLSSYTPINIRAGFIFAKGPLSIEQMCNVHGINANLFI